MEFNATKVSFEYNKYDVLVIYFESDSSYLMIQYKDNHSELDVTLGMDTYHIERDNQGLGGYGGVKNWSLSDDSIFIELDEKGKSILETDKVEITFKLDKFRVKSLREKLEISLGKKNKSSS